MIDVTHKFPLEALKHDELTSVFLSFFGHGQGIDRFKHKFYKSVEDNFLQLTADKEGKLRKIEVSDDFTTSELNALISSVKAKIIDGQSDAAGAGVLFAENTRVTGYFQYRDIFQITTMPPESPAINFIAGSQPFAIRFKYVTSPDWVISQNRRQEHTIRLGRYLNILLSPRIHSGPRFTEFGWAYHNIEEPSKLTSKWTQMGYVPNGLEANTLPLQLPGGMKPFNQIGYNEYYTKPLRGNDLVIPDNLEKSLDLIYELSEKNKKQFDIASAWLSQSGDIWRGSGSASYAALVIAIEALLEPVAGEVCGCCGQAKYATTKRFQDFLVSHIPGMEDNPEVLSRLYRARSDIVHGKDIFEQDLFPWRHLPSIRGNDEWQINYNAHHLVSIAVYNWLHGNT